MQGRDMFGPGAIFKLFFVTLGPLKEQLGQVAAVAAIRTFTS